MPGLLLAQPYPDASTCIVVGDFASAGPPDLRRYRGVLWCTDAGRPQPLATGSAVQLLPVGPTPPVGFTPALEAFIRRDPRRLPSVYVSDTVLSRHAGAYHSVITEIHAALERHHRARTTRQKDGFTWQKYLLQNLAAYAGRRVPPGWAGALRGVPAFVCGAGPSLDVSAGQLAAVAGRGVVFAADSALRALARRGVPADFAVSIDVAKVPDKCLPVEMPPARVVLAPTSPPAWADALPLDRQYFLSSTQITIDWLASLGLARTAIPITENCGSTALELARHLGCAPIYLFGLDLATDAANPSRRHHAEADATLYANSGYNPAQSQPSVPGNYAATVPTFAYGDWQTLDARLASWPSGLVVNVNDRGARLRNTTLVHPARFSLGAGASNKDAALASLAPAQPPGEDVRHRALAGVRAAGRAGVNRLPALQAALLDGGPDALAGAWRDMFTQSDIGRVLGAFSLKIMPHLVPPIEGGRDRWRGFLDEFAELVELAANA